MRKTAGVAVGLAAVLGLATVGTAETQMYNGREMQRVGCSLPTPSICVGAGGRRVDSVGIWIGDSLHWRYTDVTTPVDPRTSASISAAKFIRSSVLQQSAPATVAGSAHRSAFRADVFYNQWEGEFTEGSVYGINPTLVFGDGLEVTIRVPLHMSELDGADTKVYHYGADLTLQANASDNFKFGAHAAYIRDQVEDDDVSDATGYISGGPYFSLRIPLGSPSLTVGCLYEYGMPEDGEDGDETSVVVPAVNLGLPLSDSLGVNVYGIYYYHTDSELSDYNYLDVGGDLVIAMGDTWLVSVGAKTIVGLDSLDSIEGYLGSEWRF
jgi:hypothetical protein